LDREDLAIRDSGRGGFSMTWRWHWWELLADLGARQSFEQSEAVAGGKGRHGSRFSKL
jgi:hypothetical protein